MGLLNGHTAIERLLAINAEHSMQFVDPAAALERRLHRAHHPTEIAALKCMDGRLHLPVMTQTPVGLIQPWRNLGGVFNLGWPAFKEAMAEWVSYSTKNGHMCLPVITYHHSKGDKHRGCRGFGYNTQQAMEFARTLKLQFDSVFGVGPVHAIQVGIETDDDALTLHGDDGTSMLDLATVTNSQPDYLIMRLRALFPNMHERILHDLLPLVEGNIRHIAEVRRLNRPNDDVEHKEWVLGVGRGFDWLHVINTALLIGPYDPNLSKAIRTGASLIYDNIEKGRIQPEKGVVLITAAPFRESAGFDARLAKEKAVFLQQFTLEIIEEHVPQLMQYLQTLAATVDMNTRKLHVISRSDQ